VGEQETASAELKAIIEALIFASPEPLTPKMLFRLLADEPKEDVAATIEALKADYESRPGLQMVEVAGGYQIVTRTELHEWVRRLFHERSTQKLTVQSLETLAVIAYKQPITALEVGEIRGVNTSAVLSTLLERHLIKIVGRKNVVGRPFLYATTKEFLIRFGLKDLGDLPKIEDMAEALGIRSIEVVPKGSVHDGITAAKALLEKCYFDEAACRKGLDALAFYHRVWDPKGSTWKDEPAKDWSTHAADALRMGAQGTRGGVPLVAQPIVVETRFDLGDFASGRRDSERTLL